MVLNILSDAVFIHKDIGGSRNQVGVMRIRNEQVVLHLTNRLSLNLQLHAIGRVHQVAGDQELAL